MDDVEVRVRPQIKSEDRPKPVKGSFELDPQHEFKHDLRIEQGHAVCFDNEISNNYAELQNKSNIINNNNLEMKSCSEIENDTNGGTVNDTNDIVISATNTNDSDEDTAKVNAIITKYETMKLRSQESISKFVTSTDGNRKISRGNGFYRFKPAGIKRGEYVNVIKDDESGNFVTLRNDDELSNVREGNKHSNDEHSSDLSEGSRPIYNEMKTCCNYTLDNSDEEDHKQRNYHKDDVVLRNINERVATPEKHEVQQLRICNKRNEQKHIYVDMNFSNNHNEKDALFIPHENTDDHKELCETNQNTDKPLLVLNKKVMQKEGYLQKQGGADRNQGWKKRWFVLDTNSLRYYRDKKSSISLRIIPVALMRSVTPVNNNRPKSNVSPANVSDLFSTSGRQYQFTLECKQRTFQFGTDSLENCQQWQSSLMAAIIDYQKESNTELPYGGEMNSPDISGSIKFDNNKTKYFVAIKGKVLRYYHNLEDFSVDCPIHELSMERTSVKELKKTVLQLDSPPDQKFVLNFELEAESQQWKTYIEASISRALGDDKVLERVWQNNDNRICADCYSPDPEWASINLGIVICTKCAGPHRSLGVKRSKVRSLRMDNLSKENEDIIHILENIGNKKSNRFWCKKVDASWIIDEQTPSIIRQKFIEEKYLKKKFADILQADSIEELNMALSSGVDANDIMATLIALFSGADLNSQCPSQDKTIIELANESTSPALKEFLEQNKNTDVTTELNGESSKETSLFESSKKTAIYHEGYLDKTGPKLKSYTQRWCVLHYGGITYFNKKQGPKKGFVDLADATSVSIVTGQRKYSFDINMQMKDRTYRFAAPDEAMFRKWLNVLIQVIYPFEGERVDRNIMAGYFYFKKQLTFWAKIWLDLETNALHIRHRDDPNVEIIPITRRMKCMQYNVGKHSEKTEDVIRQLDNNQTIELISAEGHVVAYFQGMTLKDTRKLVSLMETSIQGHS